MKSFFLLVRKLLVWSLLAVLLACASFAWWALRPVALSGSPLDVTIKPNSSVQSTGQQLQRQGVDMPAWAFHLLARLTSSAGTLKAGGYRFEAGESPYEIVQKIARGDVTRHYLTIIEGWTFARMRATLDAHPALRIETRGMSDTELMKAIGAREELPEGLFFPDTYLFAKGSSDLDLYRRAYRTMQSRLAEAWENRSPNLPYRSPYDAVIMASIVEKETGRAAERPRIASVFVNRLNKRMLLQTDPTVIYGLGDKFDGNLRKRDLQTDTPHNTYTRPGLPPTPIALPGRAALHAALHPEKTDYLYFVARGDGSSQFSTNLTDHNRAVNRYQRRQSGGG